MKLQTKLLLILVPIFLVAVLLTVALDYRAAKHAALSDLKREADNVRGVLMATRRVYHRQFLESGLPLNDHTIGFLPAHAMSRISVDFDEWSDSGLTFSNVSDRPRNPENQADAVEMESIAFYRDNPVSEERFVPFESEDGESYYHYSRPIRVEQYCLKCHGRQEDAPPTIQGRYDNAYDYEIGDLRGILSIKLPGAIADARAMASVKRTLWSSVATFGFVFGLVYWLLIRYTVRRLKRLASSVDRLADGDYGCSTGITGGDEVARVASLFDDMVQKLSDHDRKLRSSEQRYRQLVEGVRLIAWESDVQRERTSFVCGQASEILGYPAEAWSERKFWINHVHADDRKHARQACGLDAGCRGDYVSEYRMLHAEGRTVWIRDVVAVVRDPGKPMRARGVMIDITDRKTVEIELRTSQAEIESINQSLRQQSKELEKARNAAFNSMVDMRQASQRAEAATKSKSEFLANMSHEIRTPMTAILGFTDILLGSVTKSDDIEAATTIRKNGKYLLHLINDILDLSKIEAKKIDLEWIDYSPQSIVADVVSLVQVRADAKGLSLETQIHGPIPETIHSDPTRLRQVLINIVGNAVKFTETGSVQINLRLLDEPHEEPQLQFDVVDSGIGMSADAMDNLFNPFTQADNSTTRRFGGTGLGLTISQRLMQMLGGEISVRSSAGQGSTFTLTVPCGPLDDVRLIHAVEERIDRQVEASDENADDPALDNCRVLLAEDGPDNQRLISFLLKKSGAEVVIAENGQVAVERALESQEASSAFDVILMDMQMPVLDGYSATRQLREQGWSRPIIALTAHAMQGDRERCLAAGCDEYLTKPIHKAALLETVAAFAERPKIESGA